jgi:hypothetical protein
MLVHHVCRASELSVFAKNNRSLTDALVWKKSGVGVQCTKLPPLADEQSAQTGQGQSNK